MKNEFVFSSGAWCWPSSRCKLPSTRFGDPCARYNACNFNFHPDSHMCTRDARFYLNSRPGMCDTNIYPATRPCDCDMRCNFTSQPKIYDIGYYPSRQLATGCLPESNRQKLVRNCHPSTYYSGCWDWKSIILCRDEFIFRHLMY